MGLLLCKVLRHGAGKLKGSLRNLVRSRFFWRGGHRGQSLKLCAASRLRESHVLRTGRLHVCFPIKGDPPGVRPYCCFLCVWEEAGMGEPVSLPYISVSVLRCERFSPPWKGRAVSSTRVLFLLPPPQADGRARVHIIIGAFAPFVSLQGRARCVIGRGGPSCWALEISVSLRGEEEQTQLQHGALRTLSGQIEKLQSANCFLFFT